MSNTTTYWLGTQKAELAYTDVLASWGTGPHCSNKVDMANFAFLKYYEARTNINSCSDVLHAKAMRGELEDAATSGWGLGVQDLDDAFEHLATNSGKWRTATPITITSAARISTRATAITFRRGRRPP